jgi:hypothetical protein
MSGSELSVRKAKAGISFSKYGLDMWKKFLCVYVKHAYWTSSLPLLVFSLGPEMPPVHVAGLPP